MEEWLHRGIELLDKSLSAVPMEMNELDWKVKLSDNPDKIAKHLSAFANYDYGGYMVFGIENDASVVGISQADADDTINKLGSIARNTIEPAVCLDSSIINFKGKDVLLVHIHECHSKPAYIRDSGMFHGSYIRSSTQSVKAIEREVRNMVASSTGLTFEEGLALKAKTAEEVVLKHLDYKRFFELHKEEHPFPASVGAAINVFHNEGIIKRSSLHDKWDITNKGAILFASNLSECGGLKRKAVRVIIYEGTNKDKAKLEQLGARGYAVGFEGLINFIDSHLPQNEVIKEALREQVKMYPKVALREFIANALIHQDFNISGAGVMIELFADRIEITNPGIPLVETMRFIDTAPRSRNEQLASHLRRVHICEERGSGVARAIRAMEAYQLPAPKFVTEGTYTKVTLYAHKRFKDMDRDDRIRACFQHCVLLYKDHRAMNNKNVRDRFNLSNTQISVATKIISDTVEAGLIKVSDPNNLSRKYISYIPIWA